MLRMIVRIMQVQFLLLIVFLFCNAIAGQKNGPLWFAIAALTLVALTITGIMLRSRNR